MTYRVSVKRPLAAAAVGFLRTNAPLFLSSLTASCAFSQSAFADVLVDNCNDSGQGSLREAYAHASSGQIIDLTNLSCSKITLSSGALKENGTPSSVEIHGGNVTIDGQNLDRVFVHTGTSSLTLADMTIENGLYVGPFGGGCIYSTGSVRLSNATVTNCILTTAGSTSALGGAIFAQDSVSLLGSKVTDSAANSGSGLARGGGIYASRVYVNASPSIRSGSVIAGNKVSSGNISSSNPSGGGIYASTLAQLFNLQLSGNEAQIGSGGTMREATIGNSTVSANKGGGAIYSANNIHLNSVTIATNQGTTSSIGPGILVAKGSIADTIIAVNQNADGSKAKDLQGLGFDGSQFTLDHDLITSANFVLPVGVITSDPKIGPLQINGGTTKTHALLPGSPAINKGSNAAGLFFDQRGFPNARTDGPSADIGAFETSDRLFYNGLEF